VNVTLTPELEALVERKLGAGGYRDATAVVEEALRLLDERDADERLRAELQVGRDQLARGESIVYSAELMEKILEERSRTPVAGCRSRMPSSFEVRLSPTARADLRACSVRRSPDGVPSNSVGMRRHSTVRSTR
jgi:putative addiction module CopG family antidote